MVIRCLALDFGGSTVKYALVDEFGTLSQGGKLPAPLDSTEQFQNTVEALFKRFASQIDGIAISMPGYIDPDRGVLEDAGAYMELYQSCITDLVQSRCAVPVTVENDGKCAALAESWLGALSECRDGAVIVLGSGIAGGIIKNGKIHSGRDFAAGELSYLITDPEEHGDLGCAYMAAAMHGLTYRVCKAKNLDLSVQNAAPVLKMLDARIGMPYADPAAPLRPIRADGIQIFHWLNEGDPAAEEAYRKFIQSLAVVVHSVQICFAPEKISIGGGLSLEPRILPDLERELHRYYEGMHLGTALHARLVRSRYLDECNLIGATWNFLQRNPQLRRKRNA